MEKLSLPLTRILIIVVGAILFLPFLGKAPLFDWDEINFAESAREMIATGNYARVQINFQPFWEKPPLFFWLQSLSMHLFGVNEYAARFPNAIFGIITLLSVFEIGRRMNGKLFGLIWALCLAGSFLPHVYFKSGIIDPVFNYFIFMSVWFMYRAVEQNDAIKPVLFSGLFAGLAVLTKGPVGALMPMLTMAVYILIKRFKYFPSFKVIICWGLAVVFVSLAWFGPETIRNGPWFLEEFFRYQIRLLSTPDAGHGQPFYYHFVVVLLGCFPMSAFALSHFIERKSGPESFRIWMKVLFWVVMILFSLVTTKIVHYSSLAYLPLAYIAATDINYLLKERPVWSVWRRIIFIVIGLILGLVFLMVPFVGKHPEWIIDLIKDPFAKLNLEAKVSWPWYTFIPGIVWLLGLFFSIPAMARKQSNLVISSLFFSTVISISTFLVLIPWRVAEYTQQAPVEFFKSLKSKDVYIETLGYKSYAQYFYSDKKGLSEMEYQHGLDATGNYQIDQLRAWLLSGDIDKPAYFVAKTTREKEFTESYNLQLLGRKNGFSFLYRLLPEKQ